MRLRLLALLLAVQVVVRAEDNDCNLGLACQPWNPLTKCKREARMDSKFLVDHWPSNYVEVVQQAVYSFCPVIDQAQAFYLVNSSDHAMNAFNDTYSLNTTYITANGFSAYPNVTTPTSDNSRVVFAHYVQDPKTDSIVTGCAEGQVAVATFLMLNYTMSNGDFQYDLGVNMTSAAPINSGFMPTCDAQNVCLFQNQNFGSACLGEGSAKNCARCLDSNTTVKLTTVVWGAYYGTDEGGRALTSGQSNPLNFKQFSATSTYENFANSVQN